MCVLYCGGEVVGYAAAHNTERTRVCLCMSLLRRAQLLVPTSIGELRGSLAWYAPRDHSMTKVLLSFFSIF